MKRISEVQVMSMEQHCRLWCAAINTPPPRLLARSRRNTSKFGKMGASSESLMSGFNHVSVRMTKLQSVVSIRLDSESRLGKILLMLVYKNDRGVWCKCDERVFSSYVGRGTTFCKEWSKI